MIHRLILQVAALLMQFYQLVNRRSFILDRRTDHNSFLLQQICYSHILRPLFCK